MTQEQSDIVDAIVEQNAGATISRFYDEWMANMGENSRRSGTNRRSVADFTISRERDKDTVVIVGPGASLKLYTERFPELQEVATIVTCPTALHWAKWKGFTPDIVVVADSHASQWKLLDSAHNAAPVFASVTSDPGIYGCDVYWYTPIMGNGKPRPEDNAFNWWDIPAMLWNQDIDWSYPSVGCVVNMAVQIVQSLRAKGTLRARRIVLLGVDFGPWNGMHRCPPNKNVIDYPVVENEIGFVRWDDCLTDPVGLTYKRVLLRLWQESLMPIYTMSHGLMHEFPRVTVDNVLRDQFPQYPTKKEVNALCDQFYQRFADDFPRVTVEHFNMTNASVEADLPSIHTEGEKYNVIPEEMR